MNKAVFMDRDGVINELVCTNTVLPVRAPYSIEEFRFRDNVFSFLKEVVSAGFKLFIVSNQPDYAKGFCGMEELFNIHNYLHKELISQNIFFTEYLYCYHHPYGIVKSYTYKCQCRKPSASNVLKAINKYDIDASQSFFIGDRDTDMQCGKAAGLKTILMENDSTPEDSDIYSDYKISNISEALKIVLQK
ncbi:MAG TPA: HAD-IIIA family hydrolase [Ignavibacteria bacterium]|nr:HAD-IIIA family hydrolase [Ignavibacteria bacterium]